MHRLVHLAHVEQPHRVLCLRLVWNFITVFFFCSSVLMALGNTWGKPFAEPVSKLQWKSQREEAVTGKPQLCGTVTQKLVPALSWQSNDAIICLYSRTHFISGQMLGSALWLLDVIIQPQGGKDWNCHKQEATRQNINHKLMLLLWKSF